MISIRDETSDDHDAIHELTIHAFGSSDFGHNGEADLVDHLRSHCKSDQANFLSLVACSQNKIVGHILFTPAVIRADQEIQGMGLGPMCVSTDQQNKGIGSQLVKSGLKRLASDGCPFVVVLGHPDFYPRFGFLNGSQIGVTHGFAGIPQDVFFVNILDSTITQNSLQGPAYYRPEFGPQHGEA